MSRQPARTDPKLQRVAFTVSRLAEFCSAKELIAQTGHAPGEWVLVVAKELVDNALDACEEAETAPELEVAVSTERGEIVITDNGPGLPAETLGNVLDYTSWQGNIGAAARSRRRNHRSRRGGHQRLGKASP